MGEWSDDELDELIEQVVVDAYGDDEQRSGSWWESRRDWRCHSERPRSAVDALIAGKTARHYQAAVALLGDLRELSTRGGDPDGFARRLADLRAAHQRKPALIERLDGAGLR